MASKSAPGDLAQIQDFVNTREVDEDRDDIAQPAGLRAWLAERGLMGSRDPVTPEDAAHAQEVREALRALLFANNGEPLDPDAPHVLDDAARRAGLVLRFEPSGGSVLVPSAAGVDGALGRLLTIASDAMADGIWDRLKACRAETCQWAFYDATRNRSGVWCSMRVCGNREKVRTYRARQATA